MTRILARSAFFFSGVAGLTFEIVWLRHLGWAVGGTTLAVATTTAAYMGGLALGSHIGGRFADRLRRPLAVYGSLEITLAVVGLLIPHWCTFIPGIAESIFGELSGGGSRALVRFFVATAVLIIPTTAMGMTLPILSRAVADKVGRVGREVGILYSLNIAGAMIGAALAGFWWIPHIGLLRTNLVAVCIDLLLGVGAVVGGIVLVKALNPKPPVAGTPILRPGSRAIVAMLVVTGAAAMALQVLFTRGIGTALGPSTYAFSAIVCTYLAGLAIGGAAAAWLSGRIESARLALTLVLLATATFSFFGIVVIDDLPILLQKAVLDPDLTVSGLFRWEFALAGLAILPATIGMGAIFPLTLSAVVGSDERLGAAVGRAYALNTVGNILGSAGAVFILLPWLGVEGGLRAAAVAYAVVAGFFAFTLEPARKSWRGPTATVAALVLVFIVAWPSWNIGQWTAGMFRMSMTRYYYPDGDFDAANLVFHKDGLSTTVTVEEENDVRWIKVNGKIDGSSEGDMPTQVLSGVLPMLFRDTAQRVAVIGCGSGVTVGAALQAEPESVTLIELEHAVIEAAKLFAKVNYAFWDDPRVQIVEDDGRNFLRGGGEPYDVIISEPSNPWMTGAASLFTAEFFRIAASRLVEDGTFLQWLQIYELAPERIASVLKTFNSVFPHVIVFTPEADSNDLLILGSRKPWQIDWGKLESRFVALEGEMTRAGVSSPDEFLSLLLFSDREIAKIKSDVPLNTDDNAFIEFGAPRDLLAFADDDPDVAPIEAVRGKRAALVQHLSTGEPATWPERHARLADSYLRQGFVADALVSANLAAENATDNSPRAQAARIIELVGLLQEEDRELVIDGAMVKNDPQYAILASLVQNGEEAQALAQMEAVPEMKNQSGAHSLLYGFLLYRADRYKSAQRALLRANDDASMIPHARAISYYLAKQSFESGDFDQAVEEMARYRETASRDLSPSPPTE